jgi:3-deoxy-D-arabino-heptulosonate 7-phosphate (DAHP) synthase class II
MVPTTVTSPKESHQKLATALRKPAAQQPAWPEPAQAAAVVEFLSSQPPLVVPAEIRALEADLARVAEGRAFLLQGGDCAETFANGTGRHVLGNAGALLRVAAAMTERTGIPVVRVGRFAGQYAKPRSSNLDELGLPAYRGDIVNSVVPDPLARVPDPMRMIDAYRHARATLELLRSRHPAQFYTSHEALLLDYERSLTIQGADDAGPLYGGSAHFLWIGERTRQLGNAHIAFAELLDNPIGVKIGPGTTPAQAAEYCDRLNPHGRPGRLTLITRMGASQIRDVLGPIVEHVTAAGYRVVWQCDPMHGNTRQSATGYKTRHFDDIIAEIDGFFDVHRILGTVPGGIHLEFTGDPVTECLGGSQGIEEYMLSEAYESVCDPRLNARQFEEVAEHVSRLLGES